MIPSSRSKVIVASDPWSPRKAIGVGIVVAATSMLAYWGLNAWNTAWDYQMPIALFLPMFITILLIYPIATVCRFYRRLPTA